MEDGRKRRVLPQVLEHQQGGLVPKCACNDVPWYVYGQTQRLGNESLHLLVRCGKPENAPVQVFKLLCPLRSQDALAIAVGRAQPDDVTRFVGQPLQEPRTVEELLAELGPNTEDELGAV